MSGQRDKCPECKGDGRVKCSNHTTYACEECDGSGYIEEDCPKCHGTGEKKLDSLREKITKILKQHCNKEPFCGDEYYPNLVDQFLAFLPDIEELKKQIDIKRDYAFGESLFGSLEHQERMQAAVNTYDVVLKLIKDIGGK